MSLAPTIPLLLLLASPASGADLRAQLAAVDAAAPPDAARSEAASAEAASGAAVPPTPDPPTLDALIARAVTESPRVRAAHARWEAAVRGIAPARGLPEPTLSAGVFVQPVETRVGPQRARLGIQQAIPWPTALTAAGDAASAEARAVGDAYRATALAVARDVAVAWWSLWEIRTTRATHQSHLDVLDALSATLRGRLEVGRASLADLQQVDLSRARLADGIAGMDQAEVAALARLRAAAALSDDAPVPTTQQPPLPALPRDGRDALLAAALTHPALQAAAARIDAAEDRRRAAAAARLPGFAVGADWILTGTGDATAPDAGKDAFALTAGLRLPLWQGRYRQQVAAAEAATTVAAADADALEDRVSAELDGLLAAVRDSARRVSVTRDTLLPQAEAAYRSVLGATSTGQGSVAAVLLAQEDLLELRVQLDERRAAHARAWAALEARVGLPVARREGGAPLDPPEAP